MTDRRDHPKARTWSLLLASLALTADDDLRAFRDRRAADPRLDLEKLRRARGLLDAVAQAIESADAGRWERLVRAFALVEEDAAIAEPSNADGPSSSADPAPSAPAPLPPSAPSPPVPLAAAPPRAPSPWIAPPAPIRIDVLPAAAALDSTTEAPALHDDAALPFRDQPNAPPPPSSSNEPPHPEVGETAFVEALVLDDPLPFQQDESRALSLEQYASFTVERELYGDRGGEVRARYGLDAAAEADNDRRWRARLDAEPAARAELEQKRNAYRDWLRSPR